MMSIRYIVVSDRYQGGVTEMNHGQHGWPKLMLRLPPDAKQWIAEQAIKHGTSQNSEILRAVRERMDRHTKSAPEGAATPTEA